jgi:hypothetical protein
MGKLRDKEKEKGRYIVVYQEIETEKEMWNIFLA